VTLDDPAPVAPVVAPAAEPEAFDFAFTGNGREYFRIWIVNLLLSVITLGVYSAWAKVRRLRYFHRNTRVAGSGFDYHGNPIAILKGRLIAMAGIAIYFGSGFFGPVASLAAVAALMALMPWVVARSLRFRMHNTSYRGIRFRFSGSVRSAYWVFLGLPLLSLLTLFTLIPFVQQRAKRYQYRNTALGRTPFTFEAPVGEFYVTAIAAAFLTGVIALVAFAGLAFVMVVAGLLGPTGGTALTAEADMPAGFMVAFFGGYAFGILAGQAFATAQIQNLVWRHTRLGAHRFSCRLRPFRLFLILITNLLFTIATFGMYRPFAQVRLASYLAETMTVMPAGSLDEFSSGDEGAVSAVGEEAAELFDFDVGF
jgi:uncharacterized membrane protein YjgN (DUF898 family)